MFVMVVDLLHVCIFTIKSTEKTWSKEMSSFWFPRHDQEWCVCVWPHGAASGPQLPGQGPPHHLQRWLGVSTPRP